MPNAKQRCYFWGVCIPIRTVIAATALLLTLPQGNEEAVRFYTVGSYTALTAAGFACAAMRNAERGGCGGLVWWHQWRLLHVALWSACAVLCFLRVPFAGSVLFADALVGAVAGGVHRHRHLSADCVPANELAYPSAWSP